MILAVVGVNPPALLGGDASGPQDGGGSVAKQLIYGATFVGTLLFGYLARRLRNPFELMSWPMIAMIGWCWISLAWAAHPEIALRRTMLMTVVLGTIFSATAVLGPRRTIALCAGVLAGLLIADVLASIALPGGRQDIDFDPQAGQLGLWRGLHLDKNSAGVVCALSLLFMFYRAGDDGLIWQRRLAWATFIPLGVLFLVETGSKTSLTLLPIACVAGFGVTGLARTRWGNVALSSVLVLGIAAFVIVRPDVIVLARDYLDTLGNDPTSLTGRVQFWPVLLPYISDHLWLGSGYGSFWAVGETGPIWEQPNLWLRIVPNAHNGYMDLVLQTGIIGLTLAVSAALLWPLNALSTRSAMPGGLRWLAAATLIFLLFHNFLETTIFDRDHPAWIIMMLMIATTGWYRTGNAPTLSFDRPRRHGGERLRRQGGRPPGARRDAYERGT